MSALAGIYFDGRTARGVPVQLDCEQQQLQLRGEGVAISLPIEQIKLSPRLGRTARQLAFPDGAVCEVDDTALLDEWFSTALHRRWNLIAKLEMHWGVILSSALLIVALSAAIAVWGLPWAAQKIAFMVPQPSVDQLGRGTLATMDGAFGSESKLPAARQQHLRERFAALAQAADVKAHFEFRTWPRLGANALALPGGTIVMTDELVELADDDRELSAVIAHELGHEHERHALQQLLAGSGTAALIFVLTGDVSGLSNVVVTAPTLLLHLHHSRALESAADRFGFALLCRQHEDPIWFAYIMRKLETAHQEKHAAEKNAAADSSSWLSSHPGSEERARAAEHYCD